MKEKRPAVRTVFPQKFWFLFFALVSNTWSGLISNCHRMQCINRFYSLKPILNPKVVALLPEKFPGPAMLVTVLSPSSDLLTPAVMVMLSRVYLPPRVIPVTPSVVESRLVPAASLAASLFIEAEIAQVSLSLRPTPKEKEFVVVHVDLGVADPSK